MLGDLTDDLKAHGDCRMTRIMSAGPKNYGYAVDIKHPDGSVTTKVTRKLKGFSLDWRSAEAASLENLKELIDGTKTVIKVDQPDQILRTKDFKVYSKDQVKRMGYTFDKRVRVPDSYMTWPWGTDHNAPEVNLPLPLNYKPW